MKVMSLFSGGLDSQLAVCILKEMGLEVLAVNFTTPFFNGGDSTRRYAEQLGVELLTFEIGDIYMEKVLRNPVYGFGKNLNPCIDCHAFMLNTAGRNMDKYGASFLATGEVLGQRPMSQNKSALGAVDKLSGFRGLILRPLSAKLLPPTIPEDNGWVDRNALYDISGRSRKRQMELADHYNLNDYPSPAGGCLLTDQNFTRRLLDLLKRSANPGLNEIEILKLGRHFSPETGVLLVIGRNHGENERLKRLSEPGDLLIKVADRPGPLGLLRGLSEKQDIYVEWAASLAARYSDAKNEPLVEVKIFNHDESQNSIIKVIPAPQT